MCRQGKRVFVLILTIGLAVFLTSGVVLAQGADWPKRVAIGAASPGGGFYMGASALARVVSKMPGVTCTVEITQASKHNMRLVQKSMVQLGFTVTPVAWEAWNGVGSFKGEKTDRVRTLFTSWPSAYMFITLAKTGIERLKDFEGKRFSGGPGKNSACAINTEHTFDALGINSKITYLPSTDASRGVIDGTLAGFNLSWPNPLVTQMEATHEVRVIVPSKEELEVFSKKYPQYGRVVIPKGAYKCITEDTEGVGQYTITIVDKDISEDFVYHLTKACFEKKPEIEAIWPPMGKAMNAKVVSNTPIPYHPGAVRYFKEQGVKFPLSLIPPEMK